MVVASSKCFKVILLNILKNIQKNSVLWCEQPHEILQHWNVKQVFSGNFVTLEKHFYFRRLAYHANKGSNGLLEVYQNRNHS